MVSRDRIIVVLPAVLLLACFSAPAEQALGDVAAATASYDPLAVALGEAPSPFDLTVHDGPRKRDVPIRVYFPVADAAESDAAPTAAAVVLFSHGLGGSRENNAYLGRHWSARGYVVVFLQHPGSDEGVWKEARPLARFTALRDAASGENLMLRTKDVAVVLDQLTTWNNAPDAPAADVPSLAGRMDLNRVGMSGHSFGAVTTQAVSGQTFAGGRMSMTDPRIKAAVAFSPSTPRVGTAEAAFGSVAIPWLVMTGTHDEARIGGQTPASRRAVYPALPAGNKYELVLDGAEHSAFGDRALAGERSRRNPNHHRAILALTTAFWDAYLGTDDAARAWLDGAGPKGVLEEADLWQRK